MTNHQRMFYDLSPFEYRGWKSYYSRAKDILSVRGSMKYNVGKDAAIRIDGITDLGTATLHMESIDSKGIMSSMDYPLDSYWGKERK